MTEPIPPNFPLGHFFQCIILFGIILRYKGRFVQASLDTIINYLLGVNRIHIKHIQFLEYRIEDIQVFAIWKLRSPPLLKLNKAPPARPTQIINNIFLLFHFITYVFVNRKLIHYSIQACRRTSIFNFISSHFFFDKVVPTTCITLDAK